MRQGRERGCWVYIPAAELIQAGIDVNGDPPAYRLWGRKNGSMLLRLYKPPVDPAVDAEADVA